MHRNLFPPIFSFFTIVIFILIHLLTSLCAVNEQYAICSSSYNCGDITVSYPFWGGSNRPDNCGYLGFNLHCQDGVLTMNMEEVTYRVLAINYSTYKLTIARNDYWDTFCPTTYLQTTLDSKIFSYTSTTLFILMNYGCSSFMSVDVDANQQFTCFRNGTNTAGYYLTIDSTNNYLTPCDANVSIPVSESAIDTLNASSIWQNMIAALHGGFELTWAAHNSLCNICFGSGGWCGRNVTSNEFICYCLDRSYASTCELGKRRIAPALGIGLAIAIAAVVGGIIVVLVLVTIHCLRRKHMSKLMIFWGKKSKNDLEVDAFIRNYGSLLALKQYNYSCVKKMTKSFTDKLGQGGYGSVYKGKLSDGRLVAVKVLSETKGNGEEFLNEVASISKTSHVNVVTLLGFCYKRTKRALIYEFMPNGSLDQFIYLKKSSNTNNQLEWKTLYRIAVGIARGLEYLHIGCNTRILHFDIKPHNILLDEEFCPKISDFGLAKLCQRKESIISMMGARGTVGYIAPEVFSRHFGGVSYKSDVYSYGMMVLEIVGGRRNIEAGVSQTSEIYFPHWIFKYLEPASTELRLNRVITKDEEEELARKMILVGLWCIQTKPSDRPSMTRVVEMLEGNIQSLQIPPKPFLSSPPRSPPHHSSTVSVSESSSNSG